MQGGCVGGCFFAAEERGKTRKFWRREFLTTNDTNYTNGGDGVLGDLKFARRETVVSGQWSVVSGQWSVVSGAVCTDGERFSCRVGGCKVGVLGECFFAAEER